MNKLKNTIGFTLLIASIFVFGLLGKSAEMAIAVAGSGIFLAFINIEKFSKFKGAGFEAELKEVVSEANTTINHIKAVTIPLLTVTIDLLAKDGRLGGGGPQNHILYDQLLRLQKEIGVSDSELEAAKSRYANIHAWDLVKALTVQIKKAGNLEIDKLVENEIGTHNYESPPNLEKFSSILAAQNLSAYDDVKFNDLKNFYKKHGL